MHNQLRGILLLLLLLKSTPTAQRLSFSMGPHLEAVSGKRFPALHTLAMKQENFLMAMSFAHEPQGALFPV